MTGLRASLAAAGLLVICAGASARDEGASGVFDVREHGAAGDGKTLDTRAVQEAIARCSGSGGGTVLFTAGRYLCGTVRLMDNVTLRLEAGAVLLGSTDLGDYEPMNASFRSYTDNYTDKCLICGDGLENISIVGQGAIDGQGGAFRGKYKERPFLVRFVSCRNVTVRGVTLRDSAMWVQHYLACENVNIDGVTVRSRCNANNDGIDVDSCRNVRISDCEIWSGDDAIVLKSTAARPCENIAIQNCVLSSLCNGLKMGTESHGGFRNVVISNCVVYETRLCGLALEIVDGGTMDGVLVSNVCMKDVNGAIFLRLGDRGRRYEGGPQTRPGVGSLRNVSISNVRAEGADSIGCCIAGLPGHAVENVSISGVSVTFKGGGTREDAGREVPEKARSYPEYRMFGVLPAYGFYCRHVRGVDFRDVRLDLEKPDARPAMVFDDAGDISVSGLRARASSGGEPLISLSRVRGAVIRGCSAPEGAGTFLRLEGTETERVRVLACDLSAAGKPCETRGGAREDAVWIGASRTK